MKNSNLYDVRCPSPIQTKTGKFTCNSLCTKVTSMSMGECRCRKCKITFSFIINSDGKVSYYQYDKDMITIRNIK